MGGKITIRVISMNCLAEHFGGILSLNIMNYSFLFHTAISSFSLPLHIHFLSSIPVALFVLKHFPCQTYFKKNQTLEEFPAALLFHSCHAPMVWNSQIFYTHTHTHRVFGFTINSVVSLPHPVVFSCSPVGYSSFVMGKYNFIVTPFIYYEHTMLFFFFFFLVLIP